MYYRHSLFDGIGEPPLAMLIQPMHPLRRFLGSVLQSRKCLYAGAMILVLAALPWRVASDTVAVVSVLLGLPTPLPLVRVVSEPLPARMLLESWPGQLFLPIETTPSATENLQAMHTRRWRVVGSEPTVLRQQVKALVAQNPGVVIVQEEERLLVVALETRDLLSLRQELEKLGEPSGPETAPETEIVPDARPTLLRIEFVRTLSVASSFIDQNFLEPLPQPLVTVIPSRASGEESRVETLRFAQGDMPGRFRDDL